MALTQRQNDIYNFLKKKKYCKINEISKQVFCSDATTRRELNELSKLGLIERNHGGAVLLQNPEELSIFIRAAKNVKEKEAIAKYASSYIPSFKTAFIDNSSSAMSIIKYIYLKKKTIVTNSLVLAMELSKIENISVFVPSGYISSNNNTVIGNSTIKNIEKLHFDLFISSCTSISKDGTFESSEEQASVKTAVLERSSVKILLVDETKFMNESTYLTAKLSEYDYCFTNASIDIVNKFKKLGLNIIKIDMEK